MTKAPKRVAAWAIEAPQWLAVQWEHDAPEAPQSGTIEERAEQLIAMHRENKIKAPHLLQALALDLFCACLPSMPPPQAVEQLMVIALGLPAGHEPGSWERWSLDKRGKPAFEAQATAWLYDYLSYQKKDERISLRELERRVKDHGYAISRSTLRQWRRNSYGHKPSDPTYLPPVE